jgi:hypothetical protein
MAHSLLVTARIRPEDPGRSQAVVHRVGWSLGPTGRQPAVTERPELRRHTVSDDVAPLVPRADLSLGAQDIEAAEAAGRLLDKLRAFVTDQLDDEERALLAVLLAPGVALAYPADEVVGFGVDWRATALPETLAATLRDGGLRVEGL